MKIETILQVGTNQEIRELYKKIEDKLNNGEKVYLYGEKQLPIGYIYNVKIGWLEEGNAQLIGYGTINDKSNLFEILDEKAIFSSRGE